MDIFVFCNLVYVKKYCIMDYYILLIFVVVYMYMEYIYIYEYFVLFNMEIVFRFKSKIKLMGFICYWFFNILVF